jgi:predicted nucleic acid-binding protein
MPERNWFFDTVVLSNFLLTRSTFLLEQRYTGRAYITSEVYNEVAAGISTYPRLRYIDHLIQSNCLQLTSLSRQEQLLFQELIGHLGKGEAAGIAATRKRGAIFATDDRAARNQCSLMNIPVTGTIGILKASFTAGQITLKQADSILAEMIESGFFSPVRTISDIV